MARKALDQAERSFRSAIEAGPENPSGYGSLGLLFLQRGDAERARQLFQVVLQLDPTNQAARTMLRRLQ
jgi:cytochrome c-type biogenesis protein CcmH/NrfG